ncbi:4591_t:CDS:2, partial [Dentiscutata heterogama]
KDKPVEKLVARARYLINFLSAPKQAKQLEKAQIVLKKLVSEINTNKESYLYITANIITR